jgi:hypothetical protein
LDAGEGNLVSGNRNNGISALGCYYIQVYRNFCGTRAGGSGSLPNGFFGINSNNSSSMLAEENICCYNGAGGITLSSNAVYNNVVGNRIGVDANGNAAGNASRGVQISASSYNNIGSYWEGSGNVIAFNNGFGVVVVGDSVGNQILRNSIYSNAGLGIDLLPTGVAPNDPGDPDTGPNNFQNYPVREKSRHPDWRARRR